MCLYLPFGSEYKQKETMESYLMWQCVDGRVIRESLKDHSVPETSRTIIPTTQRHNMEHF